MNQRGFSTMELVMVVAIVGILSALGYPYVTTYLQAATLRAGAQELATVINGGRQLAISRNTNVCVVLSGNNAQYRTGAASPCTGTTFIGAVTKADGTITLSNDIQITAATASVVFSALGAATTAGTYTVHSPVTGRDLSVVVAASGRVTIQ